jgi:signal transduction histidine kinase
MGIEPSNMDQDNLSRDKKTISSGKFGSFVRLLGIVVTTVAIVGFTFFAWDAENVKTTEQLEREFNKVGEIDINKVVNQIETTMEVLPAATMFSGINDGFSQDSFFGLSTELFNRYRSLKSLGWVPVVQQAQVGPVEFARDEEGFPGYLMTSLNQAPLVPQSSYLPVLYIEFGRLHEIRPDDFSWMGLDLSSHEPWTNAMKQAVETNRTTFSMSIEDPKMILSFYPVFATGAMTVTRSERRANLLGYVVAQLDPNIAVTNALKSDDATFDKLATLQISDISDGSVTLFNEAPFESAEANELSYTQSIQIFGREWLIRINPTENFLQIERPENIAKWILTGGLLLAALTFYSLLSLTTRNRRIEQEVALRTSELVDAHSQLRNSEALLMQSEKMSALGQMVAGVAHELNTPLGYVRSNLEVIHDHFGDLDNMFKKVIDGQVKRKVTGVKAKVLGLVEKINSDVESETMVSVCKDSLDGLDHLSNIVTTLKSFSRKDQVAYESNSIVNCMENSLVIGRSQYKNKVEIFKNFEEVPDILCNASEINQVFLNLILNATDSIDEFGTINIDIKPAEDGGVIVSIIDSGVGIPEDMRSKIFEPFYTTKEVGKGTGLGLFICNRIISSHGGTIEVISADGQGTEFRINLPKAPPVADVA